MIARLRGLIAEKNYQTGTVLLDVGGVFYRLHCPVRSFEVLPGEGEKASLDVEIQFRDNNVIAFGFVNDKDWQWFRILNNIQGVGGKLCLAILSVLSPGHLYRAIMDKDKTAFKRVSGVGERLAGRIVSELSDRSALPFDEGSARPDASPMREEALSALVHLGFDKQVASRTVSHFLARPEQPVESLEELIRLSLSELSE